VQELCVASLGSLALLSGRIVVVRVNAINGVKGVDRVANSTAKCADRVLVFRLRNNTTTGGEANGRLEAYEGISGGRVDN